MIRACHDPDAVARRERRRSGRAAFAWAAGAALTGWLCIIVAAVTIATGGSLIVAGTLLLAALAIAQIKLGARRAYQAGWIESRIHQSVRMAAAASPNNEPSAPALDDWQPPEPWDSRRAALAAASRRHHSVAAPPSNDPGGAQ